MPAGPSSALWPVNATTLAPHACRLTGTCPAVWAASTSSGTPCSRQIRAVSAIACTVPSTCEAWETTTRRVWGRRARSTSSGSDQAGPVEGHEFEFDQSALAQVPPRAQHRVVLEPARDDVVTLTHHALDREVERVGCVGGKDDSGRIGCVEQLRKLSPSGIDVARGLFGQVVAPAPGRGSDLGVGFDHAASMSSALSRA